MILAAIDPGKDKSACSIFDAGELIELCWLSPGDVPEWALKVDQIAIEKPRLYPRHPRPGNVLDLGWGGALVAGAFRPNHVVLDAPDRARTNLTVTDRTRPWRTLFVYNVTEWKGGVKKPPHHRRTYEKLDAQERKLFDKGDHQKILDACERLAKTGKVTRYSWAAHNLWDSTALGLFHLERAPKGG